MAQLLFSCPRARKDIQTAVYFFTMRFCNPDEYDWGKLKCLVRHVRWTINVPLILRSDSLTIIKWWVDVSYASHPDMEGHIGATISFGRGSVTGISTKNKINAKSSTKAELICADNAMSQILLTRYFIEAQGFTIN